MTLEQVRFIFFKNARLVLTTLLFDILFSFSQKYAEAEDAFRQVLKLDKNVDECHQELEKIKVFKLMQMGFPRDNARAAVRQYKSEEVSLSVCLSVRYVCSPFLASVQHYYASLV